MDKIPEKKVAVDPWGDIRPAPQNDRAAEHGEEQAIAK